MHITQQAAGSDQHWNTVYITNKPAPSLSGTVPHLSSIIAFHLARQPLQNRAKFNSSKSKTARVKAPWTSHNTGHLYLVKKISGHVFENKCTAPKQNRTNLAFLPQWAAKRQNAVWNTFPRSLAGNNNDNNTPNKATRVRTVKRSTLLQCCGMS